jgi:hypothetical protein
MSPHVNQDGEAWVTGTLGAPGEIDGFEVFFERSGTMVAQTTGPTDTELAFYDGPGIPHLTDDNSGSGLNARIDASEYSGQLYSVAVAGHNGVMGAYELLVDGPSPSPRNIPLSVYNVGERSASILGAYDAAFFYFTATVGGDWVVAVSAESALDATLVIFDSAGNPAGPVRPCRRTASTTSASTGRARRSGNSRSRSRGRASRSSRISSGPPTWATRNTMRPPG